MDFIKEYYWIAGIPLLIFGLIEYEAEKNDIEKNHAETYGMVVGYRPVYKKPSKRYFDYKFKHEGVEYRGSSIEYVSENISEGKIYKVEFSDKNPKHSRMDFDVEYSMIIETDKRGNLDTIYIPTSEMKLEIPAELKNRFENLKRNTETKTKHNTGSYEKH